MKEIRFVKSTRIAVLILSLVVAGTARGQSKVGTSVGQFLGIEPSARNAGMGKVIDRALRAHQLQVNEVMELDSSETVVGMARAGIGAGIVPLGRLRRVPPAEVVVLPFGDPPIQRRVVLIERRNNPRSDLSQLVYDAVRQVTTEPEPG